MIECEGCLAVAAKPRRRTSLLFRIAQELRLGRRVSAKQASRRQEGESPHAKASRRADLLTAPQELRLGRLRCVSTHPPAFTLRARDRRRLSRRSLRSERRRSHPRRIRCQPRSSIGLPKLRTSGPQSAELAVFLPGLISAPASACTKSKRLVYIVRSDADASRHYVGITSHLEGRLDWHNHGPCGHTVSHRPWSLVVSIEFPTERAAVRFEKDRSPVRVERSRSGTSELWTNQSTSRA